jgi:hypothetical protein
MTTSVTMTHARALDQQQIFLSQLAWMLVKGGGVVEVRKVGRS